MNRCAWQVASSNPGGRASVVSVIYPSIECPTFRRALHDGTRACVMIAGVVAPNRCNEGSTGTMHGSGEHLRRDGFLGHYPMKKPLQRRRRKGTQRDQASARGMAKKLLHVWQGVCIACHAHLSTTTSSTTMLSPPCTSLHAHHLCTITPFPPIEANAMSVKRPPGLRSS